MTGDILLQLSPLSHFALLLLCNYDRTIIEVVRKRNGDEKQTSLFEYTKKEPVAALDYVFLTQWFRND
ncbi:MAG: hypothetical protein U9Q68_06115 [Euryarchaeota archaeon]|nr:MAG: hypothetical protein C5S48_06975 [ANME-2 cluster archaeon]MEA3282125.1 hypothetical protein [Euryarchaeota archaeon]